MKQSSLFPPKGVIEEPLPQDVLRQAVILLAGLLTAVLEQVTEEHSNKEGRSYE